MNKELTKMQMEEMLPDYVFERLKCSDRQDFESNLNKFPELQQEIAEVRAVFARFEKMDVDADIRERTRNMSIKVNQKLKKRRKSAKAGFLKFAVPIAAVLALAMFVFQKPGTDFTSNRNIDINSPVASIPEFEIDLAEIKTDSVIIDNGSEIIARDDEPFEIYTGGLDLAADYSDYLNTAIDNEILNAFFEDQPGKTGFIESGSDFYYSIYDDIQNIDEDEFQILLEAIENEDFNS
jgi:hypothetical protein